MELGARLARITGILGLVLIAAGLLLLFYTSYLVWGTSVYTRAAQTDLTRQITDQPLIAAADPSILAGEIPAARPASPPGLGDPLFKIVIPKIGLRSVVVEGVDHEELKLGPGRFPEAPWPGEDGNVAISGHRTTFGAPFFRLDELAAGDIIAIESGPARYRYAVSETVIVHPSQVEVVADRGRNELTLVTCHPRFSAAQRLIVHADYLGAELIGSPGGRPPGSQPLTQVGEASLVPASPPAVPGDVLVLLALALASGLAAMALSKQLRVAALWSAVVVISAVGLWTAVFPQLLQLMPANY